MPERHKPARVAIAPSRKRSEMGSNMEKAGELFLKYSRGIVYGIFTVIVLYLFLISLFTSCAVAYTDEHTFFIKDFPMLLAPGLIFLLFVLYLLKGYADKRKSDHKDTAEKGKKCKRILACITVVWFLVMLWWVLKAPAIPMGDQESVFVRAKELLEGDYTYWKPGSYMHMYPYQNTMVMFFSVFHFLFGESALTAVKLFNLVCWYAGILALSALTEKYFGRKTALWAYLALLAFFPACGYVTYIYGTIPGICCSFWGVLQEKKYEETGKLKYLLETGVLLLLAVMWKSNYIIFVIAVVIMLVVHAIRERQAKPLVGILLILMLYFAGTQGALVFISTLTGEDTRSGILFIGSIVDGLTESVMAPGWYSGYAEGIYSKHVGDASTMAAVAAADLKNTLAVFAGEPEYALRFFSRKITSMWSAPFLECTTLITKAQSRSFMEGIFENILCDGMPLNTVLFLGLDVLQSVLYFGVLLLLIFDRKKKDLKNAGMIICFLGGFLFYVFWEGKSQYILPYYLLLIPYGIEGFRIALNCFDNIKEEWKNRKQSGKKERIAVLYKDKNIVLLLAVFVLAALIMVLPEKVTGSAFKIGTDTTEYIWFCQNNRDRDGSYIDYTKG